MKAVLGIIWAISPVVLINFPLEVVSNGLPHWPAPNEFIPRKEAKVPSWAPKWLAAFLRFNHYAKNALATVVKVDWGFWGQFIAFLFWLTHIGRTLI